MADLGTLLDKVFDKNWADLRTSLAHSATDSYATRPTSALKRIVIHHSASASKTTTWEAVANWHVNNKKYPGVAYHLGIGAEGKVVWLNPLTNKSYHCGSYATPEDDNYDTIGICVLGNFQPNVPNLATETPTVQAIDALRNLIGVVDEHLGRKLAIIGHRDVGHDTVCPGDYLYSYIPTLRGTLEEALRRAETTHEPLLRAILIDGYTPMGAQFEVTYGGITYCAQRALGGGVYLYYVPKGRPWTQVKAMAV